LQNHLPRHPHLQAAVVFDLYFKGVDEVDPLLFGQTKEERVNLGYAFKVKVKNDGRLKMGMPGEVVLQ
jgi:hypothetical protein